MPLFVQELTQDKLQEFGGSQKGQKIPSTTQPANAPSGVSKRSAAPSSAFSTSDPRILKGDERTKFVTSIMNTTFCPEKTDAETIKLSHKVSKKVTALVNQ